MALPRSDGVRDRGGLHDGEMVKMSDAVVLVLVVCAIALAVIALAGAALWLFSRWQDVRLARSRRKLRKAWNDYTRRTS